MNTVMDTTDMRLDLDGLRSIGAQLLAVSEELTHTARGLRLPLIAPATDARTLELAGRINDERRSIGLLGEAAADELVRMAEQILAGTFTLAVLARRTQIAIIGLAAPPMTAATQISPAANRSAPPPPPAAAAELHTDDEILSAAVLLSEGTDAISGYQRTDTSALSNPAQMLLAASGDLRAAASSGAAPAATLERFARWISSDYSAAIEILKQDTQGWADNYALTRRRTAETAQAYVSALAAILSGQAVYVDPSETRAALAHYDAVAVRATECAPFPQLGVSPGER